MEKQSSLFVDSISDEEATLENIDIKGEFQQQFCHQSGAAFAQIIFGIFVGNRFKQKCAKMWHSPPG
jgi:hypothetical protein